jgi:large repetitive protein
MRFPRSALVVALLALVVVPGAFAIRFTDDSYNWPIGMVGQAYSKQLDGAAGCGPALPYQFTLIGGSLPPGLSLSFSGLVSGTPRRAGSYSFWINLSDENPPSAGWCRPAESQREFTITIVGRVPPAEVRRAFTFAPAANGGKPGYTWSLAGALPSGLVFDSATGVISGRPAAAGSFPLELTATDAFGFTHTVDAHFSVAPHLTLTTKKLRAARVGRAYHARLATTGGVDARTWSIVRTSLPAGVRFSKRTGIFSGMPRRAGKTTLLVQVTDALGAVSRATLVLNVRT